MTAGWTEESLGELCHLYQPESLAVRQLSAEGPYPVYGANGEIGRYDRFNHADPQLVIGCRGSVGLLNVTPPQTWITSNAMVLQPRTKRLDRSYLAYALSYIDLSPAISGVAQPQITRKSLSPISIPIPPLMKQKRIVAVLDEALKAIATATANTEQSRSHARELFRRRLDSIFATRGASWITEPIADRVVFVDYRGKTPPKADVGVRLITAKNVKMGHIQRSPEEFVEASAYDGWMTRGFPQRGDVLFTTEAPLGNVAQLDMDERVIIGQRLITMKPQRDVLDSTFLSYMLQSGTLQHAIQSRRTGATVAGIKASLLKQVEISYPDLSSQVKINKELAALAKEVAGIERLATRKRALLAELKAALLARAFSGELTAAPAIAA